MIKQWMKYKTAINQGNFLISFAVDPNIKEVDFWLALQFHGERLEIGLIATARGNIGDIQIKHKANAVFFNRIIRKSIATHIKICKLADCTLCSIVKKCLTTSGLPKKKVK